MEQGKHSFDREGKGEGGQTQQYCERSYLNDYQKSEDEKARLTKGVI